MSRYPVFIVGSPRSGTSVLVDALQGAGYHGFREGLFVSVIHPLNRAIDRHFSVFASDRKRNMISRIDQDEFKARVHAVVKNMTDELNPKPPWFDKTGNAEMIQIIPTLLDLWPGSVFIFAKRRAIENIMSRQKKFPNRAFEEHCIGWAKTMRAWRAARVHLLPDQYVEIDQQDMLRTPSRAAERLSLFLGLEPRQEADAAQRFRDGRPQETEPGSALRVGSLESSGWNRRQIEFFMSECGAEMEAFGYTISEDYATGAGTDAPAPREDEPALDSPLNLDRI